MAASAQEPAPGPRVSDRLNAARGASFTGRAEEVELFRQAVGEGEPPFAVLYVFGPGGVGKTTLLREYARIAAQEGRQVVRIDGRAVDPSPEGLLSALAREWRGGALGPGLERLSSLPPAVLLIDTYERIAELDDWIRETFLPQLPAHLLVVIAGRAIPSASWRVDPAWRRLARLVSLRNLQPEEGRHLLSALKVPPEWHEAALALTHGHPLALVLLADWLQIAPSAGQAGLSWAPDAVRLLVERFMEDAPSPRHRQALAVCAHARVTTEALLAEVLGAQEAPEVFAWLRTLCFMDQGPEGLFPHDLVRDVLEIDMRWRNPEAYRLMHGQIRDHARRRFLDSRGLSQQRAFLDFVYMHRQQPLMGPYFDWRALDRAYIDPARPEDHDAILQMVERHEGEESARLAAHWLEVQPEAFEIFRGAGGTPMGFAAHLLLEDVPPEGQLVDPALQALWPFVRRHGPLRPGERVLCTRFEMGQEVYQGTLVNTFAAASCTRRWLTTPGLRWAFICVPDPAHRGGMFAYLNFRRSDGDGPSACGPGRRHARSGRRLRYRRCLLPGGAARRTRGRRDRRRHLSRSPGRRSPAGPATRPAPRAPRARGPERVQPGGARRRAGRPFHPHVPPRARSRAEETAESGPSRRRGRLPGAGPERRSSGRRREAVARQAVLATPPLVGAWGRKP